jgi:glycosyltransferase involved in cell wall biosynthesis
MKIAFIARSTLYTVPGGDSVQILQTAKHLREAGVVIDIFPANEKIRYQEYDLIHLFNITRPADILLHFRNTKKKFVLTPNFVDYSEYDKNHRKGLPGFMLRHFSGAKNEYIKTVARWLWRKDKLISKSYLWKGQKKSIQEILKRVALILPNSEAEYRKLEEIYGATADYFIIPNGVDTAVFRPDEKTIKDDNLILCVARIEGIKNQANLIQALNHTKFTLLLVGSPSPNQSAYYQYCRKNAAGNIIFHERVPQEELVAFYKKAAVHALPSWFETCGLSSLEAAAMGCRIVISDKGFVRDYFGNDAFYCDPGNPESIYQAVKKASENKGPENLRNKIFQEFTWANAAAKTLEAYRSVLSRQ